MFASDALSSSAYATEEILRTLDPASSALLAFACVVPITLAMVGVLVILMFSYRQTIKAYPTAGGAYIVTKDNFGLLPAQVAGVALLTDYILTVAVSVSAGVAALVLGVRRSAPVPGADRARLHRRSSRWGNLRGVQESGRIFAVPTYFVPRQHVRADRRRRRQGGRRGGLAPRADARPTTSPIGPSAARSAIFLLLHAFASGGAAMTGVEAISNGVPAFKKPEWKNARSTLDGHGRAASARCSSGSRSWPRRCTSSRATRRRCITQIAQGRLRQRHRRARRSSSRAGRRRC